jgi:hypothetical protein
MRCSGRTPVVEEADVCVSRQQLRERATRFVGLIVVTTTKVLVADVDIATDHKRFVPPSHEAVVEPLMHFLN